jgi:phospholipid/cholesterol/gamma-HCH transport system substrate-binding protein
MSADEQPTVPLDSGFWPFAGWGAGRHVANHAAQPSRLRRLLPSGRGKRIAVIACAAFVLAAGIVAVVMASSGPASRQYTAYFAEAVGVYPGSDVDVLGVAVGTIDSVQPVGRQVKVVISVDASVPVPAGADAVVIVPSVVADRYIQLSPPYTGGAQLADGATIPASRTATPVEIDQIYASIAKFAGDLGPNGVNKNGALSGLVNTGAANLAGNGKAFGTMIQELGQLYQTLQGSQGNFFATITNLEKFSAMLKTNDSQVRTAQNQLAQVSSFLANDRQALTGALSELATALSQVRAFISDNRSALKSNITKLQALTKLLVNQRASLAEALDNLPLAADNFLNAYDPVNGTLDSRGNLLEVEGGKCAYTSNPDQHGCPGAHSAGASSPGASGQASGAEPLPLPATGASAGGSSSTPGTGGSG